MNFRDRELVGIVQWQIRCTVQKGAALSHERAAHRRRLGYCE